MTARKKTRKSEEADGITAFFCDDSHLHVTLTDDGDNDIATIAMDFDEGLELVQDLMRQIEEKTGLVFVVIEPDEDDGEDPIGPVMGSC